MTPPMPEWPPLSPTHRTAAPEPADGDSTHAGGVPELHLSREYIAQVPQAKHRAGGFAVGDPVRRHDQPTGSTKT